MNALQIIARRVGLERVLATPKFVAWPDAGFGTLDWDRAVREWGLTDQELVDWAVTEAMSFTSWSLLDIAAKEGLISGLTHRAKFFDSIEGDLIVSFAEKMADKQLRLYSVSRGHTGGKFFFFAGHDFNDKIFKVDKIAEQLERIRDVLLKKQNLAK